MRLLARMGARRVARRVVTKPLHVFDLRWRTSSLASGVENEAGAAGRELSESKSLRGNVACLGDAVLTVAGVLILAPELAREGGKGLRNVEESQNKDCHGDECECEAEMSRSGMSSSGEGRWRTNSDSDDKDDSRELRGAILTVEDSRPGPSTKDENGDADGKSLDAGKTGRMNVEGDGARFAGTGAISGGDESESNVSSPGVRCDSVKWGEMGAFGDASGDAGRKGKGSCNDDVDSDSSGELSGTISTADEGVGENSSPRSPSTRDGDGDADDKSLEAEKMGSKTNVEGDGARFAGASGISRGDESESNVSSPGGRCDGVEWGEMGAIGGASSDTGGKGMDSPCDDSDSENSGGSEFSWVISATDTGVDSNSQGLDNWLRDPDDDND
ncbi:hypothetical protein EDB83DRAFT_2316174 [Lactarius deliciosus]|nr:hypothetical protein EDB83DRAFT_2316174 [Lactarius deliciosus]